MGVCWYFIDMSENRYLLMPKVGEWANDMYKLIAFLKSATGPIMKVRDDDSRLDELLKGCKESEMTIYDEDDLDYLVYSAEELSNATTSVLFRWHSEKLARKPKKEVKE